MKSPNRDCWPAQVGQEGRRHCPAVLTPRPRCQLLSGWIHAQMCVVSIIYVIFVMKLRLSALGIRCGWIAEKRNLDSSLILPISYFSLKTRSWDDLRGFFSCKMGSRRVAFVIAQYECDVLTVKLSLSVARGFLASKIMCCNIHLSEIRQFIWYFAFFFNFKQKILSCSRFFAYYWEALRSGRYKWSTRSTRLQPAVAKLCEWKLGSRSHSQWAGITSGEIHTLQKGFSFAIYEMGAHQRHKRQQVVKS